MSALLKRLMLPAMLALAVAPFASMDAKAQGIELDLSGRNPQLRLVDPEAERLRNEREREAAREQRRQDREDEARRRDRDDDFRRCDPDMALDKAARLGVRRARVTAVGRRFIEVSGRRYGNRVEITFARDRRCSIVD